MHEVGVFPTVAPVIERLDNLERLSELLDVLAPGDDDAIHVSHRYTDEPNMEIESPETWLQLNRTPATAEQVVVQIEEPLARCVAESVDTLAESCCLFRPQT